MRTTVEIDDELRAELLKVAGERGEKGYSSLVNEVLREYLDRKQNREDSLEDVYELRGILSKDEADECEERLKVFWS